MPTIEEQIAALEAQKRAEKVTEANRYALDLRKKGLEGRIERRRALIAGRIATAGGSEGDHALNELVAELADVNSQLEAL